MTLDVAGSSPSTRTMSDVETTVALQEADNEYDFDRWGEYDDDDSYGDDRCAICKKIFDSGVWWETHFHQAHTIVDPSNEWYCNGSCIRINEASHAAWLALEEDPETVVAIECFLLQMAMLEWLPMKDGEQMNTRKPAPFNGIKLKLSDS